MRVRFFTDGEARPGNTEARWEISGHEALEVGSGLGVSQSVPGEKKAAIKEGDAEGEGEGGSEGEKDPFADADAEEGASAKETSTATGVQSPAPTWKNVASVKKITSGTYLGV
jgi:hypothetical protein